MSDIVRQSAKLGIYNRERVMQSTACGCYFCLRIFPPALIKEWADDEATALCPHCDTDSVLAGVTDKETLAAARTLWFSEVGGTDDQARHNP